MHNLINHDNQHCPNPPQKKNSNRQDNLRRTQISYWQIVRVSLIWSDEIWFLNKNAWISDKPRPTCHRNIYLSLDADTRRVCSMNEVMYWWTNHLQPHPHFKCTCASPATWVHPACLFCDCCVWWTLLLLLPVCGRFKWLTSCDRYAITWPQCKHNCYEWPMW